MNPEQEKTLRSLRERAVLSKGEQCNAEVAGWFFILDHDANGMPGKHLSARLVPPGRDSTDEDWGFLGKATAVLGATDDSLLTPFETTHPNAVHHWHWDAPKEFVERLRTYVNSSSFKTAVADLHGQSVPKPGRNDPCPCGSGKKHKHCCFGKPDLKDYGPCDGADSSGVRCGKPSCGVDRCKLCEKSYRHCHNHHGVVDTMIKGHVLRVHPETLPKSKFLKILKNPDMMNGLKQQREQSPELWRRFFEYVAEVQKGLS